MLRREPRPQHEVPRVTELCRVPRGSDRVVMAAVERRETRTDNGDERIRQPVVLGAERLRLVEDRLRLLTTAELEQGERESAPRVERKPRSPSSPRASQLSRYTGSAASRSPARYSPYPRFWPSVRALCSSPRSIRAAS